jgi:Ni/Co efflux regulator RcnB
MKVRTHLLLAAVFGVAALAAAGSAAADGHRDYRPGVAWSRHGDWDDHRGWRDHRDWDRWRDRDHYRWVIRDRPLIVPGAPAYYGPPVYYQPGYTYYRYGYPRHPSVVIGIDVPPLVIPLR